MRIHTAVLAVCLCAAGATASAQQAPFSQKGFVTVNGGFQAGSHDLSGTTTTNIYGEDATISSQQKVKSGGFFDLGGGYKVMRKIAVGIAYSHSSSKSDASVSGAIPDPVFFDRPRPFSSTLSGARHTENVIHLDAVWMNPVTDKIAVNVSAGPSIFMVKQDLLSSTVTVSENPFLAQAGTSSESKSTAGINFGVDVTYLIRPNWGVGGLARYSWGSVNLPGASKKLTVGGFQIGAGGRFLF